MMQLEDVCHLLLIGCFVVVLARRCISTGYVLLSHSNRSLADDIDEQVRMEEERSAELCQRATTSYYFTDDDDDGLTFAIVNQGKLSS